MAKQYTELDEKHQKFIRDQKLFFTASATAGSRVNVSPRSTDVFRIVNETCAMYLDRTGSGNETAAHLLADGRLTFMFCSVEGAPLIMRLYGRGRSVYENNDEFTTLIDQHFEGSYPLGTRQLVVMDIELVQTSCGFGVPLFDYQGERETMDKWTENKGADGVRDYQEKNNQISMDGLPTGLPVNPIVE